MNGNAYDSVTIVYQDDVMLAANKPAPLLVHSDGTGAATLTDAVARLLAASGPGSSAHPQAVNRLDVDTTGLVLFSLDPAVQPALDAQVAGHSMRKRYLAVVSGRFPWEEKTVDAPIGRDRHDSRRMRACRPGSGQGKASVTCVRRLAVAPGGRQTLLAVELKTGRRHQIRVHLASLGYPIVGDPLYGGARSRAGLLLHAWSLDLDHPVTGERLRLATSWPERLGPWTPVAAQDL